MIAIFIALSGTAVATSERNSVSSHDIANGSIKAVDLAPNAVTSPKVKPDSLTGADIREKSLKIDAVVSGDGEELTGEELFEEEFLDEELDPGVR